LSPSSSVLLLAKTITHPAARSFCDSWASCYWLRAPERIKFKLAVIVYRALHGTEL